MMNRRECCVILPEELLIDILLRLPVKCLARFKCVSKSWFSLISDPSFVQTHFELDRAPTHGLLLSLDGCGKIASIDFDAPSLRNYTIKILEPPQIPLLHRYSYPKFLGSCRGFILFELDNFYYIWNPCTGLQRRIPPPPIRGKPLLHGFGYDSSTHDYLLIICYREVSYTEETMEIHAVIFSVRANKWKQFDGILPNTLKYGSAGFDGGLFFNGAIHWIASNRDAGLMVVDVIVVFDLTEGVFFEIDLPDNFNSGRLHVVMGGFLSVCPLSWSGFHDHNNHLLVIEEYNKMQSSWKWKCLSISNHHLNQFKSDWLPLCVTEGGGIILIDTRFRQLVKLNDKGEVLEHRDFDDYPYRHPGSHVVFRHTHTLLSLPCL